MAQISNTAILISTEVLANSLGGTLLANGVQVSNTTCNGSICEFLLAGHSLPINFGSETFYPPVTISVYAGANGNATDTLVVSGNVIPTQDQGGAFIINGLVVLHANGNQAPNAIGGGANLGFGCVMQLPVTTLAGSAKSLQSIYAGATSNGSVNAVALAAGNIANISWYAQPATGQNNNCSITSLAVWLQNNNTAAATLKI